MLKRLSWIKVKIEVKSKMRGKLIVSETNSIKIEEVSDH